MNRALNLSSTFEGHLVAAMRRIPRVSLDPDRGLNLAASLDDLPVRVYEFKPGYVQYAGEPDGSLILEVASNRYLADDDKLDARSVRRMAGLGFHAPDDSRPNWWRRVRGRDEAAEAARAAVRAVLEVYGTPVEVAAQELGLRVVEAGERRPSPPASAASDIPALEVKTLNGVVSLLPDGTATVDGESWSDRPVTRWGAGEAGTIFVEFAMRPDDDSLMWVGFVPDSDEAREVLNGFVPNDQDLAWLAIELATMEQLWLEAIVTGRIPSYDAHRTLSRLHELLAASEPGHPPRWHGMRRWATWPDRERYLAAHDVWSATTMRLSADSVSELNGDTRHLLLDLQEWVQLSPWRDDFAFVILTDGRSYGLQRVPATAN